MADFLSRLAERALGVAPSAQPVIASMFAPGPTLASPSLEDSAESVESLATIGRDEPVDLYWNSDFENRNPTVETRRPVSATKDELRHSDSLLPEDDSLSVRPTRFPVVGDQSSVAPRSQGQGITESAPVTLSSRQSERRSLRATNLNDGSFTKNHEEPGTDGADGRGITLRQGSEVSTHGSVAEKSKEERKTDSGETQSLSPHSEARVPRPESGPRSLAPVLGYGTQSAAASRVVRPQAVAEGTPLRDSQRTTDYWRRTETSRHPPESPTIRVTIGRVEVRAILPPAPTATRPAAARSSQTLSLEDYLKQRDGGQR